MIKMFKSIFSAAETAAVTVESAINVVAINVETLEKVSVKMQAEVLAGMDAEFIEETTTEDKDTTKPKAKGE